MIYYDINAPTPFPPCVQALLHSLGLPEPAFDHSFQRLADLTAAALHAPGVLIALITADHQLLLSSAGMLATAIPSVQLSQLLSFCQRIQDIRAPLVIDDTRQDSLAHKRLGAPPLDIAACIGVPIPADCGSAIGVLCAIDTQPRRWADDELANLQNLAAVAATELDLRRSLAAQRRLAAQRAAADSIQFHTQALDVVEQAIAIIDLDGTIVFWNRFAETVYGWTAAEALGRNIFELIATEPWPYARLLEQLHGLQSRASQATERLVRRRDGATFPVWSTSVALRNDVGDVVGAVNISSEISARHRAEAALRESEERYQLITENSSDLISLFDEFGRYVYASPSHQQVTGYNPAMLIGASASDFVHPDDRKMLREKLRAQNGRPGLVQITFRYYHADGSLRWCEATITAFQRQSTRYLIGVGRDVTERKRLEAQLQHAQKMESIGRLAGGVAHDFNNLLAAIIGYADLLDEALPPATEARNDLAEIQKAARRAASLTRQLLAFARRQIVAPQPLSLSELILDMDNLLRRLIGENIELTTLPSADLWPIKADPSQIEQVLVNLVVNARDAMPEGGRLIIETANVVLDLAYVHEHISVIPGPYVLLTVSDTGTGMSEEVKRHLFEPFFTTKELDKGTGLGLATCYGIVKQHGGNIWAYSEIGHGTTIRVYLPCIEDAADRARAETNQQLPCGSETVLLVEDEAAVRALSARVLRAQGYRVIEAANGVEALQIARSAQGAEIALVLTDVIMPQMGGKALVKEILALHPDIKVLYTSGYAENLVIAADQLDERAAFIQKPASPAALARKVRQVLDGGDLDTSEPEAII
jgi:PAS domain S-box-containing protein